MANPAKKSRAPRGLLVMTLIAFGCSPKAPTGSDAVRSRTAALTTTNGFWQNGLTTNGLIQNGFWQNGFWQNGFWQNGFWQNGFWQNGFWQNGFWQNGFWQNGFWQNGLAADTLRDSVYARQLLQYVYSCAMPAGTYDTYLDPNEAAPLLCSTDADCDTAYACSAEGKCVVPLQGGGANGSGLGVNADGTTWWADGICDESCQRWVSACVLARTNAYGVHVQISMRAPTDAPQAVKDALATTPEEIAEYTNREGAYYGNIFATTPADPPPPSGNGDAQGAIASTPVFYACAGPDSNIPEITKRFCSSQGDLSVIEVPGVCITTPTSIGTDEAGACAGKDAADLIHDCYTTTSIAPRPACADMTDPSCFKQVLTVFLKTPLAVCGNGICEKEAEDDVNCPSDCHPGTWSKSFERGFREHGFNGSTTGVTAGVDAYGSIIMAGTSLLPVDLGEPLPGEVGLGIVKVTQDGTYKWGKRYSQDIGPTTTDFVAIGGDGSIVISGTQLDQPPFGRIWLGKFDADGNQLDGWPIAIGDEVQSTGTRLAIDAEGSILVSSATQGARLPSNYFFGDAYVHKVAANREVMWTVPLGLSYAAYPNPIAVNAQGDVFVSVLSPNSAGEPRDVRLLKLSGRDGSVIWDSVVANANAPDQGMFCALAVDGNGDAYVTNASVNNALDSGLEKFAGGDGHRIWTETLDIYHPSAVCYAGHDFLSFGPDGNLVASMVFGGFYRTTADLGGGEFESYATADVAIAAYSPEDTVPVGQARVRWSTHMPMVLNDQFDAMCVDPTGRIVVNGAYSGSMLVDGQFLVNSIPELETNPNVYLASFGPPLTTDVTPPRIGLAADPTGATVDTVPSHIYTQATGPDGAVVFYMPPTATDDGHAGASVACTPPPFSTFPLGTTTVTCAASDPLGNRAGASFLVTVTDGTGPVFAPPPTNPAPVEATSGGGAPVTYPLPTAIDQVDGPCAVTCNPASGTPFAVGVTSVTCSASDNSGNTTQATFDVTVTPPPFGAACGSSADCAAGACVDGVCCDTAGASCGACHACNVPGSVGVCAPISGTACDDGDACTTGDTCSAGTCAGGASNACDDGNACTVDTCEPRKGCRHLAGNAGVVCRPADDVCDSPEVCTGHSPTCPRRSDRQPPVLGPGTDQTVVGGCDGGPIEFEEPPLLNGSCEDGTTVTCTWRGGGDHGDGEGTCGHHGSRRQDLPGDRDGAQTVTCVARDAAGNVSAPVSFTVTVVRPRRGHCGKH